MHRAGLANLPLHYGRAPSWLVNRMCKLARQIVTVMIDEYGQDELLRRIADPFWFQALGCVLGYDWHSSGVTTVLTGVLKTAIVPQEHGVAVCGGKGRASRLTGSEIEWHGGKFGFPADKVGKLRRVSRLVAKVDSAAIQAGYQLYHHSFFLTEEGKWTVVQQGMSSEYRTARRYHWLSEQISNLIVEPHNAIVGDVKHAHVLDMTARTSEDCRKISVDLAKERPERIMRLVPKSRQSQQKLLDDWVLENNPENTRRTEISVLSMPRGINWKTMRRLYETQPANYEELLTVNGVGPATVRGLALIAELIYGEGPSWQDPVKYSFAFGGKDGVPYPVNKKAMDSSIEIMHEAIEESRMGSEDKIRSLKRLRVYVAKTAQRKCG